MTKHYGKSKKDQDIPSTGMWSLSRLLRIFFNISGIILIYPIKVVREIPLYCAEKLAELSLQNRLIPLIYLGIVFVLIPLIIILLGG